MTTQEAAGGREGRREGERVRGCLGASAEAKREKITCWTRASVHENGREREEGREGGREGGREVYYLKVG